MDSKYGVPTVAIHTNAFEKVVQSVTQIHGMPQARYTFVPQPVMGKTAEQLRAYVDGKSPISGPPVMQEIIEGARPPRPPTWPRASRPPSAERCSSTWTRKATRAVVSG